MILQDKKIFSHQRGFSLIEALVAFLILSVGMLGIASLQLLSLKAGHTASLRTVAVIKADEIMERIRSNPTVVAGYASTVDDLGVNVGCNATNMCTQNEMARNDIFNWKADLLASLPNLGATASVDVANPVPGVNPAAVVTVTINWQERNPETQVMDDMSFSVSSHICDSTAC